MQLYTHVKHLWSQLARSAEGKADLILPVSLAVLALLLLFADPQEDQSSQYPSDNHLNPSLLGQLPYHMDGSDDVSKEALQWLSILKSYDERHLSNEQLMKKFKNMSTAYTILCTTASGDLGIRFWSEEAIKYGKLSAGVLEGMIPLKNKKEESEINTRLLIAMGMNYYGGGLIQEQDISLQFEKIPAHHLVRSGYLNNRILLALHNDGLIELPFLEM